MTENTPQTNPYLYPSRPYTRDHADNRGRRVAAATGLVVLAGATALTVAVATAPVSTSTVAGQATTTGSTVSTTSSTTSGSTAPTTTVQQPVASTGGS